MKAELVPQYLARIENEATRETRFQERAAYWQRWIDEQIAAEIEGGGDPAIEASDLIPEALAQHHDTLDQEMAVLDAERRRSEGELRRALIVAQMAHTAERRHRVEQAGAMRRRIVVLEARLDAEKHEREALAKTLGIVQREIAKDRALHRMRDGRRLLPAAQRADLERARRKTDRAIEDRMLDGGMLDA